jgi:hypothetical protein
VSLSQKLRNTTLPLRAPRLWAAPPVVSKEKSLGLTFSRKRRSPAFSKSFAKRGGGEEFCAFAEQEHKRNNNEKQIIHAGKFFIKCLE